MTELSGLRFDIYERVHLDENGIGIGELEELELSPYIEVHSSGEQAILRGNLLLTGKYVGVGEERSRVELEYAIPVEISIPMSRIQRLEDIQVEIENFDIDLLSARSLNVTGLLTLHGIQMVSEPAASNPWSDEEEILVVNQAEEQTPWQQDVNSNEYSLEQQETRNEEQEINYAVESTEENSEELYSSAVIREEDQQLQEFNSYSQSNNDSQHGNYTPYNNYTPINQYTPSDDFSSSAYEEEQRVSEYTEESEQPLESANFIQDGNGWSAPQEEKKELKVAFVAQRSGDEPSVNYSNGIQNLLHSSSTKVAEGHTEAANQITGQRVGDSTGDELEWKNLFLNGAKEESSFSRLRMCIVQKEETISTIAERYNLNPREILLYNRLGAESQISEGQLIYIPK